MEYRPREGIELVKVCDTFLLVPTRVASAACPNIARLGFFDAIIWKRLQKGARVDELCAFLGAVQFKDADSVRERVVSRLKALHEKGFLIAAEEAP